MSLKQNVVNALMSGPIRWVNFNFKDRMISPVCYYLVAGFVSSGRIQCQTNPSLTDHDEQSRAEWPEAALTTR